VSPYTFHAVRRGSPQWQRNLDRAAVAWIVDDAFAGLRREVGLPVAMRERANTRKRA